MSQNFETCYSTLSNMRAYGQKCYNFLIILFTFLSPPNTYLSLSLSLSLSLLSCLHLSVAPYFFLTFIFLISHSLPLSLSTFQYYRRRSDSIHAQNFSDTSPSHCTAICFPTSLAQFALLIGSIHPQP